MTRRTGMRPLRIAMIGQKGIPARYGGVETHVENVAVRLARRGHDVWVFCRSRFRPGRNGAGAPEGYRSMRTGDEYHGVRLVYRPSLNSKHLDAASHTFLCALEAGTRDFDIVHFHGIGPSAFAPVTKLFGRRVVSTFHALDWRQHKWGTRAKRLLQRGEAAGAHRSDGLIAVSRIMQRHIRETHGVEAEYIPNGATIAEPRGPGGISRWGLAGDDYVLSVGRIIPDRELHTLIEAFVHLNTPLKLVIVGSETPRSAYSDALERMADDRVIFTGDLFGDALEDLYANCRLYVLASRVEGLPITVCEAMAHRRPVLLSDIPENLEVGGDAAEYFKCMDVNGLARTLESLLEERAALEARGAAGFERARSIYNWDLISDEIEAFYYRLIERR
jgi:glycosyltransferase involved in cell wall biosynthesis